MSQSVLSDHAEQAQAFCLFLHCISQDSSNLTSYYSPVLLASLTLLAFHLPGLLSLLGSLPWPVGSCCYFQESILFLATRLGSCMGVRTLLALPNSILPFLTTCPHLPACFHLPTHIFQLPLQMLALTLSLTFTCGLAHSYEVTLSTEACQDHKILEGIFPPHKSSTQLQQESTMCAKTQC